ncbi:MAG: hypothetical protein ACE5K7_03900, partial [Phycisphaerae bacterium]
MNVLFGFWVRALTQLGFQRRKRLLKDRWRFRPWVEMLEPRQLLSGDLAITGFSADGLDLLVDYEVAGQDAPAFQIGIYRSSDGVTAETLLTTKSVTQPADLQVGAGHRAAVTADWSDVQQDYWLIALLDADGAVAEDDETNNQQTLGGGLFLDADNVVQVHGTDASDVVDVSQPADVQVTLNGTAYTFGAAGVSGVHVRTHGGGDYLSSGLGVALPIWAFGGTGDDDFSGGAGADYLAGGAGNDSLVAGDGQDQLLGGDGQDLLYGDGGADVIYAGAGDDYVRGGSGSDQLYGDDGNDEIYGAYGGGPDYIYGGAGDDVIYGDQGWGDGYAGDDDWLYGQAGNDTIYAEGGNDQLFGDQEDDYLDGGEGADTLDGGTGINTLVDEVDAFDPASYTVTLPAEAQVGDPVLQLSTSDPDGEALTYSIISGDANGDFSISSHNSYQYDYYSYSGYYDSYGQIRVGAALAPESTYTLTVKAEDPAGHFATAT